MSEEEKLFMEETDLLGDSGGVWVEGGRTSERVGSYRRTVAGWT